MVFEKQIIVILGPRGRHHGSMGQVLTNLINPVDTGTRFGYELYPWVP